MDNLLIFTICNVIILISSTIAAVCTIINTVKKPAQKYREKQDAELKEKIADTLREILPELLKAHDLETRERYKSDRERYLNDIKKSVLHDTQDELQQVKILKMQYDSLIISAQDVLREKIMNIYIPNKIDKTITYIEKERLDQFYKDYKALNGNSYIDKYYNRMKKWAIIDDDYIDDDEGELI